MAGEFAEPLAGVDVETITVWSSEPRRTMCLPSRCHRHGRDCIPMASEYAEPFAGLCKSQTIRVWSWEPVTICLPVRAPTVTVRTQCRWPASSRSPVPRCARSQTAAVQSSEPVTTCSARPGVTDTAPHPILMAGQFAKLLASLQIPDHQGLVVGAGGHVPAVRCHRHGRHRVRRPVRFLSRRGRFTEGSPPGDDGLFEPTRQFDARPWRPRRLPTVIARAILAQRKNSGVACSPIPANDGPLDGTAGAGW